MAFDPSTLPPIPRPGILEIAPYVGGKAHLDGVSNTVKLSSNESLLGASPAAVEAVKRASQTMELYPDGGASALRAAIADTYNLDAERIVCGCGSDNLLEMLIRAYVGPGDDVVYSAHGFLMYKLYTLSVGGRPIAAPENDLTANVDAMIAAVTPRTKMVFIANPNNPTGTCIPHTEIQRLRAALPRSIVLVLDCAYAEYMTSPDYDSGFDMTDHADENVVVTRTFSKIYGLGGVRLGWAYCPPTIADLLNRIRSPFNVTAQALAAGEAAIRDQAHVEKARIHTAEWRTYTTQELNKIGLTVQPSHGNFVLIQFKDTAEAEAADQHLQNVGYILRNVAAYGLPHCLRMTIGLEQHCKDVVRHLTQFLQDRRS